MATTTNEGAAHAQGQTCPPEGPAGRQLVLCFDGTNNQFGTENTSVVRITQVLTRDVQRQLLFYDPGVGTFPEPGYVSALGKWFSKVRCLAFGADLFEKVAHAYTFLMDTWQPGDQVFLFGFSRGSYTARALAALLHMYGLLPTGGQNLLPYLLRLLKSAPRELRKSPARQSKYRALCDEFRETFAQAVPQRADRRFPVYFVGLFDTVSSVGWVWDPLKLPFTHQNPSIAFVRHAVSIDERRAFFRQNVFGGIPGQDLQELWFAGVHSDVGGGYPEREGGLWRESYHWMLAEAKNCGLLTDVTREQQVWERSQVPERAWIESQHESLRRAWWIAEFVPKIVYSTTTHSRWPRIGLGRHRRIPDGAKLHPSVVARIRQRIPPYIPPNLPPQWVDAVRQGRDVELVVRSASDLIISGETP
jgi:uncharacterized protein (DUF2235 family)